MLMLAYVTLGQNRF